MRAALSILGLVIVLAIVMVTMRNQARQLAASKAAPATSSEAAASQPAGALPNPAAVGQQVTDLVMQGAARSSDAQP